LLHCKQGADRTGMASALALLLQPGTGPNEARRQLGLRYGHIAIGRPAYLDRFLELYTEWLAAQGAPHSPGTFRHWLKDVYCPDGCRCRIEALDVPSVLACG